MKQDTPRPIHLSDYRPPDFEIDTVALTFRLYDDRAEVTNRMTLRRTGADGSPLIVDGEDIVLENVTLDGSALTASDYTLTPASMVIENVPDAFTLEIATRIEPQNNTRLEGLYRSSGTFCTQCEAEGFRRITYFIDRPDVLARFTVRIEADQKSCPVLLSNGNPGGSGVLPGGRHYAEWNDPHPKPSYLFALVAGDLALVADRFTTASGREVALGIYVEHGNEDKAGHAMQALKASMRWDEVRYGLEYDLDVFNIVAVSDFNMGAMENKGLNIFNAKYVLASQDTATDGDYEGVESVIAHEYFHNWTGNRVTCRDWFQLTLKEGLTVFRDQQFSADQSSAAVKRIHDVQALRSAQFPEDAGPMAHAIQPESYIEINNFYTATVYEKGAEVIRMLHTLLGEEGFRAGIDLYFERHDGQAVTCGDFLQAMEDANARNLASFRGWYAQAGTPEVQVSGRYDATAQEYHLTLKQQTPPTPGQPDKVPLPMPISVGLIGPDGAALMLESEALISKPAGKAQTGTLIFDKAEATYRFRNVPAPPVPSLFRGFSAPVKIDLDMGDGDLAHLACHDTDWFNRWESAQNLGTRIMLRRIARYAEGTQAAALFAGDQEDLVLFARFLETTLSGEVEDQRFLSLLLQPSGEAYLAQQIEPVDPDTIHAVRDGFISWIAAAGAGRWGQLYEALRQKASPAPDPAQIGRRMLRHTALRYITQAEPSQGYGLARDLFATADNMTDRLAALNVLVDAPSEAQGGALEAYYRRFETDTLAIDKWFSVQARSKHPQTLANVSALMAHPAFNLKNPNRLRALIGAFAMGNQLRFHDPAGGGYRLLIDVVTELDALNPQTAARLLSPLRQWRRFEPLRREAMRAGLESLLTMRRLSPDVFEVASKSLG